MDGNSGLNSPPGGESRLERLNLNFPGENRGLGLILIRMGSGKKFELNRLKSIFGGKQAFLADSGGWGLVKCLGMMKFQGAISDFCPKYLGGGFCSRGAGEGAL